MDLSWLDDLPPYDERELSHEARAGLGAARWMSQQAMRGNDFGVAIREFGDSYGCHSATIRRWINKARLELTRAERYCETCGDRLPCGSRTSRRYCDLHASPAARVRRHRSHGQPNR